MRRIKAQLLAAYPNGLSFEPMTLRLLRRDFPKLNDDMIAMLKNEMLEVEHRWFFPVQLADTETQLKIGCQAEEWLTVPGFFSYGALFTQFEAQLAHCRDVEVFERFFDKIQLVSAVLMKLGPCQILAQPVDNACPIAECASAIAERVNAEGGEIAEKTLLEANPYLDAVALAALLAEYQSDALARSEVNGVPVWRSVAVASENLPADFNEVVTRVADRLIELDYGATFQKLEMILSIHYGIRFLEEYNLTDGLFRKMVTRHYSGERRIKWANSGARLMECNGISMAIYKNQQNRRESVPFESNHKRRRATRFHDLGVPIGAVLEYYNNPVVTCLVTDAANKVNYKGKVFSISALAASIANATACNGFQYFCYEGETLWNRRLRLEGETSDV